MDRRQLFRTGAIAAAAVVAPISPALLRTAYVEPIALSAAIPALPWPAANDIVAATKLPNFPGVNFVATDPKYGAKGDNSTDNTAAFRKAIEAASAAGGGHVIVPKGNYVTGAIHLKSNVDFHLESGAVLKFSSDASKFPVVLTRYEGIECMNRSPMVYAYGQSNIALTGSGTLDANATSSWNKGSDRAWLESRIAAGVTDPAKRVFPGAGHTARSTFIEPYNCDTVLIQGVTLKNPKFWQIHPTLCKNVTVDGVKTDPSTASNNTDGVDPESCDHVVIANRTLGAHDDNIAIKAGRDADGRRIDVPCQNIVVVNCTMNGNWGAITCGSEQTGGIRNVYAHKLNVIGATKFALYVKSNTKRGGFSQNINLDAVTGTFQRSFVFVTSTYNNQTGNFPPAFGPFSITNSSCRKAARVFDVSGLPNAHVKGLIAADCKFTGVANTANILNNVDGRKFTNVTVNGKPI
ncbi:glycoside hydrolase family 28 protein [Kibdelosporangium philippinense]|uniref:Glycoside hydrolase family 28 protein n=1 Tax=Kibdelosporangium philippinense TaxID=211113 RepID=A0ABS8ZGP8_9PSEU|nr:glycoside hydrolase family 28 protein [Kibdelosporangium philippinense]MCE7006489.1 glycoside hydrolase family 28 protein [Kibdelosporangium philippinense]